MKLLRHPLILAAIVFAGVVALVLIDSKVAIDLDRPFVVTR